MACLAQEAALQRISNYASQFKINLYGQVDRDRPCAHGGFAIVYQGTLRPNGTRIALKVPCGSLAPLADERIQEVLRTVHTWSKLRHQNVLELLGITTEFESTVSIVSRWAEKGNAHGYVQDKAVDPRPLLLGISQGLHYLHSCKEGPIFHGDVKGFNVLISAEGIPLLTDFGFSYLVNSSFAIPVGRNLRGTLNWMAPEQFDATVATAEGDVWSFGMTALELFTRKIPFHECIGYPSVIKRIIYGSSPQEPDLGDTCSRMTSEWWDLCCQCWERQPSSRPSMSAVAEEVFHILSGSTLRYREEIELYPLGHPRRAETLSVFANEFQHRYGEKDRIFDLHRAIALHREALGLCLEGHAGWLDALEHLEHCLWLKYDKLGTVPDLDECIILRRRMLQLCLVGRDKRDNLLYNLADGLKHRYLKQSAVGDLDEATAFHRASLDLRPIGHHSRSASRDALDSVISLVWEALKRKPSDRTDRSTLLSILAREFCGEFRNQRITGDVDPIIISCRSALERCPPGHPEHAPSLHDLALCLWLRFYQKTDVIDIDEAITLTRRAFEQSPPEHPDLVQYLKSLRTFRRHKGEMQRQPSQPAPNITEIQRLILNVVNDTLQNLPPQLLYTWGGVLCDRSAQLSRFLESPEYSKLLTSSGFYDTHGRVAYIHQAISTYFQYITLSHRWGDCELTFRDIKGQVIHHLEDSVDGAAKLQNLCLAACERNYAWAWSDTCCIDKDSTVDLQRAIGSMFRWYRQSALTIVHLADVPDNTIGTLAKSAWFERGWTLQELLAPRNVLFLTQNWLVYGGPSLSNHKEDTTIVAELERATRITESHLINFYPGTDNARLKLQWASTRRTTLPEDMAYSLFGIFNVHLPVLYGESVEHAIGRLLGEIISRSGDISVLDWVGEQSSFYSCFPASITSYRTEPRSPALSESSRFSVKGFSNEALRNTRNKLIHCPLPQFINHRLILPCIIHDIMEIDSSNVDSSSLGYKHHIQAVGLKSLEISLSIELGSCSGDDLPYILVRPWHVKLLGPSADINTMSDEKFFEVIASPFCALLLQKKNYSEYERIGTSTTIGACLAHVEIIPQLRIETLTIV